MVCNTTQHNTTIIKAKESIVTFPLSNPKFTRFTLPSSPCKSKNRRHANFKQQFASLSAVSSLSFLQASFPWSKLLVSPQCSINLDGKKHFNFQIRHLRANQGRSRSLSNLWCRAARVRRCWWRGVYKWMDPHFHDPELRCCHYVCWPSCFWRRLLVPKVQEQFLNTFHPDLSTPLESMDLQWNVDVNGRHYQLWATKIRCWGCCQFFLKKKYSVLRMKSAVADQISE